MRIVRRRRSVGCCAEARDMMMCTLLLHESAQSTAQRNNALENSFLSFVVIFPSFQLFYPPSSRQQNAKLRNKKKISLKA